VTCELHFNAFSATSTGTETLFATETGREVAAKVQAAMVSALGLRDRGLVHRSTGRGADSLLSGKAPAVLVEPYFGSNPKDCVVADAKRASLAFELFAALGGSIAIATPTPISPIGAPETLEQRVAALELRMSGLERRLNPTGI
jgi:hypothetical protein